MHCNVFIRSRLPVIFLAFISIWVSECSVLAQDNLSNTITIDRIIVPEERAATKMTVNPVLLPPKLKDIHLDFTEYALPSDITRSIMFSAPYAWGESAETDTHRGTAWLGYLPAYNLTAGLSYKVVDSRETMIKLAASYDGSRYTWKDMAVAPDGESREYNFVRENRGSLSAGLLHCVDKKTFVTAGVDYNFYKSSYNSPWAYTSHEAGKPRNCFYTGANVLDINAGYQGSIRRNDIRVKARASYFGFSEPRDRVHSNNIPAVSEMRYGIAVGFKTHINSVSSISVDADADFYSYGRRASMMTMPVSDDTGDKRIMYSAIGPESGQTRMLATVVPAYVYRGDCFNARVGVKLDISTHSSGVLHIAPDVNVSYVPNAQFAIYVKASGGEYVNSLSRIWNVSHFIDPSLVYDNSRIPLNAEAGINIGKWKGLSAGVNIAYASADNWLLPAVMPGYANFFSYEDVNAWLIGIKAAYDFRGVAELQASFRMIPGSDNVYCHWLDRARSVGDIRLSVRPVKALDVNISAEYRADRKIYMFSQSEDISASVSMRDAFSLNLGARYKFSDRWTAFAELTNITANRYYENFLVGTQCFGGHIGAVYRF